MGQVTGDISNLVYMKRSRLVVTDAYKEAKLTDKQVKNVAMLVITRLNFGHVDKRFIQQVGKLTNMKLDINQLKLFYQLYHEREDKTTKVGIQVSMLLAAKIKHLETPPSKEAFSPDERVDEPEKFPTRQELKKRFPNVKQQFSYGHINPELDSWWMAGGRLH